MLTVSLHGIKLNAPHGLYPQEQVLGNEFEVDVDVFITAPAQPWPFVDYTLIHSVVTEVFNREGQLLETFVQNIHGTLKEHIAVAEKIRVAVRKLHPPLQGYVNYSQVCFED
jgi:dihydroneopterin aldolase